MRQPQINFVLHGQSDRFGRVSLFLRYSQNYKTHYIATPWKILPQQWDKIEQRVKSKTPLLGGESAARLNAWIESEKVRVFNILADCILNDVVMTFQVFKNRFSPEKEQPLFFCAVSESLLKEWKDEGKLNAHTSNAYRAAVRAFRLFLGEDIGVQNITTEIVDSFFRHLEKHRNKNLANQYVRNVKIVYNKFLKHFNIKNTNIPFSDFKLKVVRIGTKKSLSMEEYVALWKKFVQEEDHEIRQILRRFLLMCRGLRHSDTIELSKQHYFQIADPKTNKIYHYLAKPAQKSSKIGIVPLLGTDVEYLLEWQPNGRLFADQDYVSFYKKFKQISLDLIGREITSHYGRHFAGDFIVNAEEMEGLQDVQKILGVSSDRIAEIYGQRDILKVLQKFEAAVANIKSNS